MHEAGQTHISNLIRGGLEPLGRGSAVWEGGARCRTKKRPSGACQPHPKDANRQMPFPGACNRPIFDYKGGRRSAVAVEVKGKKTNAQVEIDLSALPPKLWRGSE